MWTVYNGTTEFRSPWRNVSWWDTQFTVWEREDTFLARRGVTSREKGKYLPWARRAGGRHFICVKLIQEQACLFLDKTTPEEHNFWPRWQFGSSSHIGLTWHLTSPNCSFCYLKLQWCGLITPSNIHHRSLSSFTIKTMILQKLYSAYHRLEQQPLENVAPVLCHLSLGAK